MRALAIVVYARMLAAEPPREDKEEDKENEGIVRGKARKARERSSPT